MNMMERAGPIVLPLALLIFWELACETFDIPPFVLPSPSMVAVALYNNAFVIWFHSSQTLYTTVVGFAVAVAFGTFLGILVGSSRLAYTSLYPMLVGFNSVPKVAIVPILVVWFGIGTVPAIVTAFMLSFFPIAVNVATGLATIEPDLRDVLRSLGASQLDIVRKIGIPRSMPYLFASLKISITLAFVGSVISETLASNRGIGTLMTQASANFNIPLVFAGLVVIALMGIIMYMMFAFVEKRMTGWATRGATFGIGG
ncbi:NitT/TauT family transport system permease protein [Neorhizobium galegae]|uniref:ABC transporter permease n=1 Tax=Neorhizobium galegae TaxID=399 RepID=UPI001AE198C2|nr:ABC transporter permease [Neorhizobium galegae]MBP2561853.1 NitT/TauT family transport system permease protein [Neorhizobium galegae]MDQ0134856.1 NitT/TauT family transport system permease protein [Neorhizobium galegae]